jgi:hypothetical protein
MRSPWRPHMTLLLLDGTKTTIGSCRNYAVGVGITTPVEIANLTRGFDWEWRSFWCSWAKGHADTEAEARRACDRAVPWIQRR